MKLLRANSSLTKKKMSSGKKSGSDSADWDALREFLPTSFGKKEERQDFTKEFEKTKREVYNKKKEGKILIFL